MKRRAHVTVMLHLAEDEFATVGQDPRLHYLARFYTIGPLAPEESGIVPLGRFNGLYERMTDATRVYQRESRRSMERLRDMRMRI